MYTFNQISEMLLLNPSETWHKLALCTNVAATHVLARAAALLVMLRCF
jgi:hypothetical protein